MKVGNVNMRIVRKGVKHLRLAVCPPAGEVVITAPLAMDEEAVRLAAVQRLSWIHDRRREFEDQVRQSRRTYESGETQYGAEGKIPYDERLCRYTRRQSGRTPACVVSPSAAGNGNSLACQMVQTPRIDNTSIHDSQNEDEVGFLCSGCSSHPAQYGPDQKAVFMHRIRRFARTDSFL